MPDIAGGVHLFERYACGQAHGLGLIEAVYARVDQPILAHQIGDVRLRDSHNDDFVIANDLLLDSGLARQEVELVAVDGGIIRGQNAIVVDLRDALGCRHLQAAPRRYVLVENEVCKRLVLGADRLVRLVKDHEVDDKVCRAAHAASPCARLK